MVQRIRGDKIPRFAVADCETDPFQWGRIPRPFLWGFYDGTDYLEFSNTDDFAKHAKAFHGRIYAHNGGKFDWHFLTDHFSPGPLLVINGRIAKIQLGHAELRDSFNLMPTPLSAYQKDSIDYALLESGARTIPSNREQISAYCRNDCIYLYNYLHHFFVNYPDALTQASCAMKIWRKLGGRVPKMTRAMSETLKPWYFGGRVDCFKKGVINGEHEIADIKSAYPFAMMSEHPIGEKYHVRPSVNDSAYTRSLFHIVGSATNCLPSRLDDGAVSFPDSHGEFFATGWEIVAGLETGTLKIERIKKIITFEECTNFGEYITFFYEKKLAAEREGNKEERYIAKIFLNALYGKFGANPAGYEEWYLSEPWLLSKVRNPESEWNARDFVGGYQLFTKPMPESKQRFYNVATAASITGFVRAYLWRAIQHTSDPAYCDTDSVIARDTSRLPRGSDLGKWETEGSADTLAIAGKKMYAAWKNGHCIKSASKGVRLTASEIKKVASGQTVAYKNPVPIFSATRLGHPVFVSREVRMT